MKTTTEHSSILLIDDDEGILSSFKEMLEQEGYTVDTARTGKQALEKARSQYYNLYVIDLKLPDTKGTKLLTEINDVSPKSRKVIITGYPSLDNAVDSVNLQADAYLIKPVKPTVFLKTVADNLKQQSEQEMTSEDNVLKWVESRYKESKRDRESSRVLSQKKTPE